MSSFIEIGSLILEKPKISNVIDEDKDENEDKFWATHLPKLIQKNYINDLN